MAATNHFVPRAASILISIIALQLAAPLCSAQPRPRPKEVGTTGKMRIVVVDSDERPVAKADIHVSVWTDEAFDHNRDYVTDAAGKVEVKLPKTLTILRIWASRDSYVPLFANWWPQFQDNGFPIPDEYTFRLADGSVIGGVLKNADGQPIAGAKVEVMHVDRVDTMKERPLVNTWLAFGGDARVTDAHGCWTLDNVPPDEEAQVRLKISHPDYINDQSWGEMQQRQDVTMEQLRAKTAVITMQRGINVSGRVTEANGKPIAGAVVVFGDHPYSQEGSQEVLTDEDGKYRLPPLPARPTTVTVVAEGWMPQLRRIEITPENPSVDFQLRPGKMLRLRFIDSSGKPIPKVFIGIANWRGGESLYNNKHPNVLDTKIPLYSDERGIYEWSWAPDDAVTYWISRPTKNPTPATSVSLTADGAEKTLTFPLQLSISGSVSDVETGEAIREFTAVPVLELASGKLLVERSLAKRAAGRYMLKMELSPSLKMEPNQTAYRVRIEAAGFRSAVSDASFRFGDADATCDVALHAAPPAAGRALTAEGRPLEGATVVLVTPSQPLHLVQGQTPRIPAFGRNVDSRTTNADGSFAFPAQYERYCLMVIHDLGYAEGTRRPEEMPGDLTLSEFARVEGRLMDHGQPIAGAELTLQPLRVRSPQWPTLEVRYVAETDAEGRFAFDRATPLKCTLSFAQSASKTGDGGSTESVPLDLQPGETTTIGLGGAGREVRGQVVLKGGGAREIDLSYSLNYLLGKTRGIKPPLEIAVQRFDWRKGWNDLWISSAEGNAYLQTLHHYRVNLASDGTFRVFVPNGDYELAFHLYQRTADRQVAAVGGKIVRFNMPKGESEQGALDLGTIEIEAAIGAARGKPVSACEIDLLGAGGRRTSP
ncbi:MAG TPA: carboxypeptidase-like regulatory domain-containing protein [Pirellulales bacterium]|nr:carboxypeptidase-like regulatory domain-containing protein [Pirellulales bacterium]